MDVHHVFSAVEAMTCTGSIVILFVLAARLFLRRAPKVFSYALWLAVLFRLLCPVSVASPLSIFQVVKLPEAATAHPAADFSHWVTTDETELPPQLPALTHNPPAEQQEPAPVPARSHGLRFYAAYIWLAGVALMLLHAMRCWLQFRRKVAEAIPYTGNIYLTDRVDAPFSMGLVRPKIYLPAFLRAKEYPYIIAHEQYHIRRKDHILRLLSYLALCLHWFNPLVWVAFQVSGTDMEMSCDEAVISKLGTGIRADYASSLLQFADGTSRFCWNPVSFGQGNTKGRILNLAAWKKPTALAVGASVLFCITSIGVCALNPPDKIEIPDSEFRQWDSMIYIDRSSITPSGLTAGCLQLPGSALQLQTSEEYWLEQFQNGQWVALEEHGTQPDLSRQISFSTGQPLICAVDWTDRYGALSGGKYRIKKLITNGDETAAFYAEFQLFAAEIPGTPEMEAAQKCFDALQALKKENCLHYTVTSNLGFVQEIWWNNGNYLYTASYPDDFPTIQNAGKADGVIQVNGAYYQIEAENRWVPCKPTAMGCGNGMLAPIQTDFFRSVTGHVAFPEGLSTIEDDKISFLNNCPEKSLDYYCRVTYQFREDGSIESLFWDATRWTQNMGTATVRFFQCTGEEIDAKIQSCLQDTLHP